MKSFPQQVAKTQQQQIKVLKFGGTSVGSVGSMRKVIRIIVEAAETHRPIVVASALSGVTDLLVETLTALQKGTLNQPVVLATLRDRHLSQAQAILGKKGLVRYRYIVDEQLGALASTLERARNTGLRPIHQDATLAAGERLSVPMLSLAIEGAGLSANPFDASPLIATDDQHGQANVDLVETYRQTKTWFKRLGPDVVPVVTGFIGGTPEGHTTTLGRGGTDYSAALIASALKASRLERWTDVDGLYTDDPRQNQHAERLEVLPMEEAIQYHQRKGLGMHRHVFDPLLTAGITLHVRSTQAPGAGTLVIPKHRVRPLN